MILVVLGTWDMPFGRPLREIERCASEGLLPEPIVVQSGNTAYTSQRLRLVPFFDREELERLYDQASLVISQAGVGSVMLGLRSHKKVIAIARRAALGEHIDDHQLEILEVFSVVGSVLPWKGEGDLPQVLARARDFVPSPYPFATERISGAILDYLQKEFGPR